LKSLKDLALIQVIIIIINKDLYDVEFSSIITEINNIDITDALNNINDLVEILYDIIDKYTYISSKYIKKQAIFDLLSLVFSKINYTS